jgi:predicted extracellular nuclease
MLPCRPGPSWWPQDGGVYDGAALSWALPELAADGGSAAVHFSVSVSNLSLEQVTLDSANLTATEWPTPVSGPSASTFTGGRVPIWAIQGNGFRSPYLFQNLTTEGVVTAEFPGLGGFFIQETNADGDPQTSEGLFVATGALEISVHPGDRMQITGQVREVSGQTTLQLSSAAGLALVSAGAELPPAIELDPPAATADADVYYEALEGMLVQVSGPAVAVSPITKYGEFVIVLEEQGVTRLYQGQDNGIAIMVDDGSSVTHQDGSTLPLFVTSGDLITDLVGPLAYTYSHYKVEPLSVSVTAGERSLAAENQETPTLQPAGEAEFSLMTWNVENLFDTRDPHPADPPLPTGAEYDQDLAKVAGTILAAGAPAVVALQEVENVGVLQELAAHALLAAYQYQPVLIEGFDSRGIDVGYLVRSDQAAVVDTRQLNAPNDLFSRPPLLIELELQAADGPLTVFILNNHFLSMSAGVEATQGTRTAQAAWNASQVQALLAEHPNALIAVVGDLNSFFESLPIQTLREAGLAHVLDSLPPEERYSYIYEGESQVLDHILVTSALWERIVRVEVLHTNADYPLPAPGDTSPLHQSDHDPVVVIFR